MHMWASGRNHRSAKPNPKGHRWFESNHVLNMMKRGGIGKHGGKDENVYRIVNQQQNLIRR